MPSTTGSKTKTAARVFYAVCFILFLYQLFLLMIGNFDIGYFDGPLRILSKIYIANGLVPYEDFGVVYPPGMFFLFGKILPLKSIIHVNTVLAFIYFICVMSLLHFISKIQSGSLEKAFNHSIILFSSAIVIRIFGAGDAISIFIPTLITLYDISSYHTNKKVGYFVIFILAAIGVWFRWDWLLYLIFVQIIKFVFVVYYSKKVKNYRQVKKMHALTVFSLLAGYATGAISLLLYLRNTGVLWEALDFFVVKPVVLTGGYRYLPLPKITLPLKLNFLIYSNTIFLIIFSIYTIQTSRKNNPKRGVLVKYLSLFGLICIFIPYALGRSDWPHFVPMWYAICLAWLLTFSEFRKKALILLSFLPFAIWYPLRSGLLSPEYSEAAKLINSEIADCRNITKDIHPKSIFVGRNSYTQFLYNKTSLYLLFPNIKPASAYITEEPGIHNSCMYGKIIYDQLSNAERPMLVFIDTSTDPPENEATENMESCGYVERFLSNQKYDTIGNCLSYNANFEVRMYY